MALFGKKKPVDIKAIEGMPPEQCKTIGGTPAKFGDNDVCLLVDPKSADANVESVGAKKAIPVEPSATQTTEAENTTEKTGTE